MDKLLEIVISNLWCNLCLVIGFISIERIVTVASPHHGIGGALSR